MSVREERRVITALCADLVGSTALADRLDPEDVAEIVAPAIAEIVRIVEQFGGTVKDLAGDGVLALFGAPNAAEDDTERAVRCALSIIDRTCTQAEQLDDIAGRGRIDVRVGIETGLAVLGFVGSGSRVEYAATGDVVNTAARLQAAAEPGAVLVGRRTYELVEPLFEWEDQLDLVLRGKVGTVRAYGVKAVSSTVARRRRRIHMSAPLVGRESELGVLGEALERSLAGRGTVVLLEGEPGVGKSRLIEELQELVSRTGTSEAHQWLAGQCTPYGEQVPYFAYRELISSWLSLNSPATAGGPLAALRERVAPILSEQHVEDVVPYLATLVGGLDDRDEKRALKGIAPDVLRARTFHAVRTLVSSLAHVAPLVLVLEDLHWVDPTSLLLTESLLDVVAAAPVLLVLTLRPERSHPSRHLSEAVAARPAEFVRRLALEALPPGADGLLLSGLVGKGRLPDAIAHRLLATAEGNPFYLEELVQALVDAGALVAGPDGWRYLSDVMPVLPPTIEKLILARVDRLPEDSRELLTAGAVLGRRFSKELLAAVSGLDSTLERVLERLLELDLIRPEGPAANREYRFKHALIQEVTYQSILRRRRRELHGQAAKALELLTPPDRVPLDGVLAYHYHAAGKPRRALELYQAAGTAARALYAVDEAERNYGRALEMLEELPDAESGLRVELLVARAGVRAESGNISAARADLDAAHAAATAAGDTAALVRTNSDIGFLLAGAADYREGLRHLELARVLADELGDRQSQVEVLARLAITNANRLHFDLALRDGHRALALARGLQGDRSIGQALDSLKQVALQIGDWQTLTEIANELSAIHRRHGNLWLLQFVLFELTFCDVAAGRWELATQRVREALELNERIRDRGNEPLYHGELCSIEQLAGHYGRALAHGIRAVALAEETGHREWTAFAANAMGKTWLAARCFEEAADYFGRAAGAGREAGADQQHLRALAHLAFVHSAWGHVVSARTFARQAEEMLSRVTVPPGHVYVLGLDAVVALGRTWLNLNELDAADHVLEPLVTASATCEWAEGAAYGPLLLGRSRGRRGDDVDARQLLQQALAASQDSRLPGAAWESYTALAALAKRQGKQDEAAHHLTTARHKLDSLAAELDDEHIRTRFLERSTTELLTASKGVL